MGTSSVRSERYARTRAGSIFLMGMTRLGDIHFVVSTSKSGTGTSWSSTQKEMTSSNRCMVSPTLMPRSESSNSTKGGGVFATTPSVKPATMMRSEERRVGKEG